MLKSKWLDLVLDVNFKTLPILNLDYVTSYSLKKSQAIEVYLHTHLERLMKFVDSL